MPVEAALTRILGDLAPLAETEPVALAGALAASCARMWSRRLDVPGADNSAVDGYAIHAEDLAPAGETRLPVIGRAAAGHPFAGGGSPWCGAAHLHRGADARGPRHGGDAGGLPARGRGGACCPRASSAAAIAGKPARMCVPAPRCWPRACVCARRRSGSPPPSAAAISTVARPPARRRLLDRRELASTIPTAKAWAPCSASSGSSSRRGILSDGARGSTPALKAAAAENDVILTSGERLPRRRGSPHRGGRGAGLAPALAARRSSRAAPWRSASSRARGGPGRSPSSACPAIPWRRSPPSCAWRARCCCASWALAI